MKRIQAKMIITLSNIPREKRNACFFAIKFNLSLSTIYNHLRLLEFSGHIKRIKSESGKSFYSVSNDESLIEAKKVLTEGDEFVFTRKNNN